MKVTIYHNPRCSKSRQTLQLLQDKGFEPVVVEYLKTPPDAVTLRTLLSELGITARQLLRRGETAYRDEGLADESCSDSDIIAAMIRKPILIERPIVSANGKARIGRPPETVLEIL